MNWQQITKFCFTYAINGGAWLETAQGYRNWFGWSEIQRHMGQLWIDRQLKKTGWMTGCWIDVD